MPDAETMIPAGSEVRAEDGPKLCMPSLEKGPATFYDTESKAFWIGIPVSKVDYLLASAVVDRAKFDLLMVYNQEAQKLQPKIIKPWTERAIDFKNNVMKHLK